jgi:exosortase A
MSQPAAVINDEPKAHSLSGLRNTRLGLAIGLIALGLLFHAEVAAAVMTWIESTAYNHCFLVIPIVAFLIWDRRGTLRGLTAVPLPFAALLTLPLGLAWLTAERLGIMEGRQLAAMSMVEVLFLAMLGRRLWRALSGPLLYLYFLVPFGDFLTPKLQDVTTWFTRHGLDILGIPAYIDGYIIEIPQGTFFVAEACAGLRFLIASIAFGVLYALLMYRSPVRRIVFIAASIIVPIIANGFRALGIVVLGHVLGSAQAAATDHVLYGWIFFSVVILLLIVLGLPFRQDNQPEPVTNSPMPADPGAARAGLLAGLAVATTAAVGPVFVLGLNRASAMPEAALQPLNLAPTCVNQGTPAIPAAGSVGRAIIQRVSCGNTVMTIEIEVFASRSTAAPVNAERRHLTRAPDADDLSEAPVLTSSGAALPGWRFIRADSPGFFVAAAGLWIDGEPAAPGLRMRWHMAKGSVTGVTHAPVLVTVTPVADWREVDVAHQHQLQRQIAAVLEVHPEIGDQIRRIAESAR